jgi:hypothetical protein
MIYEVHADFDIAAWEAEVNGSKSKASTVTTELVQELCEGSLSKQELAKIIMEETGCRHSHAYNKINQTEKAKRIKRNPVTKNYVRM